MLHYRIVNYLPEKAQRVVVGLIEKKIPGWKIYNVESIVSGMEKRFEIPDNYRIDFQAIASQLGIEVEIDEDLSIQELDSIVSKPSINGANWFLIPVAVGVLYFMLRK